MDLDDSTAGLDDGATLVFVPGSQPTVYSFSRARQSDVSMINASGTCPGKTNENGSAEPTGRFMFRKPLHMATVKVQGGADFMVHTELLARESAYFDKALNGPFQEGQTQVVELDDVRQADFGFWVDILYLQALTPRFLMRKEALGGSLSTKQILTFWQLSDRFIAPRMTAMAKESLDHRLSLYGREQWRKLYRTRPSTDIRARVERLQDAYQQCVDGDIPFVDDIIAACANCPPQVYSEHVGIMEPEFMALVSKKMIMQYADKNLIRT